MKVVRPWLHAGQQLAGVKSWIVPRLGGRGSGGPFEGWEKKEKGMKHSTPFSFSLKWKLLDELPHYVSN
jgi:hypothetical protein